MLTRVARRTGILIAIAFLTGWFFLFRPGFLGGSAEYIFVSGHSMEPTLLTGDLVITRSASVYEPGDIIVFKVPEGQSGAGNRVIHRIIGGNPDDGFVTQGDNRNSPDPWHPTSDEVVGKLWLHIPGAAERIRGYKSPAGLAVAFAGIGAFSVLGSNDTKRRRQPGGLRMNTHAVGQKQVAPRGDDPAPGVRGFLKRMRAIGSAQRPSMTTLLRLEPPAWAVQCLFLCSPLAIVGVVLGVLAFSRPASSSSLEVLAGYEQSITFDYSFSVEPSVLYPSGEVGSASANSNGESATVSKDAAPDAAQPVGPTVFTNLAKTLQVGYSYEITSDDPAAVSGQLRADLQITANSPTGWTKTQTLQEPTGFEGAAASGNAVLDLADLRATIESIEQETGFRANSYTVAVLPHVDATGEVNGQPINQSYDSALTFSFNDTSITAPGVLSSSQPESITEPVSTPNRTVFGISVKDARYLAVILLFGAGSAGLYLAGLVFLGIGRGHTVQTLLMRNIKLVHAESVAAEQTQTIQLVNLEDIVRIAEREGKLLFSRVQDGKEILFVPQYGVMYEYAFKPEA